MKTKFPQVLGMDWRFWQPFTFIWTLAYANSEGLLLAVTAPLMLAHWTILTVLFVSGSPEKEKKKGLIR